ncbi:3-oxo-5-alpha-steroid 4-dehydrogenase 1-like isoform X2 [Homarus americanus]|uniref:3-oxo-5-alpha-steroid 4-dehydrogenase 1-like isoform X2 n=1 Tax=Homarus americanus TaxID=6706 RepID=UPI001C45058F|nr:3-oxo-5-alpha-steroid 4-dehydrogenase 1-like isoform X2 [Homarus americanus]
MTFTPEAIIQRYVYPIFWATNDEMLINRMCYGTVIYAVLTLLIRNAPYGRYYNYSYGFGVPVKLAWFIQECPSFFVPVIMVAYGKQTAYRGMVNQLCLGMFIMHYFHRSFIYPFLMKSNKPTPFLPFLFAFLTCLYNGILHGLYFVNYYHYSDEEWVYRPSFYVGFMLFLYGMKINMGADAALRNLRGWGEVGYKIPSGGLFEKVSCPNYFGEIVEMWGYALASLSPPAAAHAFFTTLFLSRRALDHHQIPAFPAVCLPHIYR